MSDFNSDWKRKSILEYEISELYNKIQRGEQKESNIQDKIREKNIERLELERKIWYREHDNKTEFPGQLWLDAFKRFKKID